MTENHTTCVKVSDTRICPKCYSPKIIKTDIPKPENNNTSVKIATNGF